LSAMPRGAHSLIGASRWTRRAACLDAVDVNFFADALKSGRMSKPEAAALDVCSGCPVRRLPVSSSR
jgi:hypothetical protein